MLAGISAIQNTLRDKGYSCATLQCMEASSWYIDIQDRSINVYSLFYWSFHTLRRGTHATYISVRSLYSNKQQLSMTFHHHWNWQQWPPTGFNFHVDLFAYLGVIFDFYIYQRDRDATNFITKLLYSHYRSLHKKFCDIFWWFTVSQ